MTAVGPRPVQPDARGAAGPLLPQDWQAKVELYLSGSQSPGLAGIGWTDGPGDRHIQSGRRWTFNTLDELLAFLRRQVEDPEVLRWPTDE